MSLRRDALPGTDRRGDKNAEEKIPTLYQNIGPADGNAAIKPESLTQQETM